MKIETMMANGTDASALWTEFMALVEVHGGIDDETAHADIVPMVVFVEKVLIHERTNKPGLRRCAQAVANLRGLVGACLPDEVNAIDAFAYSYLARRS